MRWYPLPVGISQTAPRIARHDVGMKLRTEPPPLGELIDQLLRADFNHKRLNEFSQEHFGPVPVQLGAYKSHAHVRALSISNTGSGWLLVELLRGAEEPVLRTGDEWYSKRREVEPSLKAQFGISDRRRVYMVYMVESSGMDPRDKNYRRYNFTSVKTVAFAHSRHADTYKKCQRLASKLNPKHIKASTF